MTPEEIAERLTDTCRAQMLDLPCVEMGAGTFARLCSYGLIATHDAAPDDEFVQATPLGLEVRRILEAKGNEQ